MELQKRVGYTIESFKRRSRIPQSVSLGTLGIILGDSGFFPHFMKIGLFTKVIAVRKAPPPPPPAPAPAPPPAKRYFCLF